MEGFDKLPWEDQKAIADMRENLIAMDEFANSSKQHRTWRSWKQASNFYEESSIEAMVKREVAARDAIKAKIMDRLSKLPSAKL